VLYIPTYIYPHFKSLLGARKITSLGFDNKLIFARLLKLPAAFSFIHEYAISVQIQVFLVLPGYLYIEKPIYY